MIHTVRGFSVVNEAEVDVFLAFSCFLDDPTDVGNFISGASAFSKPSLSIWMFSVHIPLRPSLNDFEHCLASSLNECNCTQSEYSLSLSFFGMGMKTDLFQSYGLCWVFQICWHIECSTLTALSFGILNSSAGILSPPLALLLVMLLKAQLTSHSMMSGSGWVTTPLWLSRSLKSGLHSSSVFYCHLFLISCASVRSLLFLSFIVLIFV